ncbi:MAG: hypothetical protein K2N90_10050 [Lachnospiraceae bacterium]|nr:hypothetical protein [Lachnospiraceae bacterium]
MKIQEMIDVLISNGSENFSLCCELEELIDSGNTEDAINCIQDKFHCDSETANKCFIEFKKQIYTEFKRIENENPLSPQQIAHANAVAREWQNKPKCPTCSSTNVRKISSLSKAGSVAMFGIFSQKVKHQFKCNNCGYEW